MGKAIANVFTKIKNWITGIIQFVTRPIGHVVLYMVGAILLVVLLYLIVTVIAQDIAKLLKLDYSPIQTSEKDAQFLQALSASGYDSLLNASELSEYYTFEYVVLMDAARFMEETGTTELLKKDTGKYDYREIDRPVWSWLAAAAFQYAGEGNDPAKFSGFKDALSSSAGGAKALKKAVGEVATIAGQKFDANGNPVKWDPNANNSSGIDGLKGAYVPCEKDELPKENNPLEAYSTERTMGKSSGDSGDLYYKRESNSFTGQEYLVPYLRIIRTDDILSYKFEMVGLNEADNHYDDDWHYDNNGDHNGGYFNIDNLPDNKGPLVDTKGGQGGNPSQGTGLFGPRHRFAASKLSQASTTTMDQAQVTIYDHVFPYAFNSELNQSNSMALTSKDPRYVADAQIADLNKDYGVPSIEGKDASIYYGWEQAKVEYNVPLRVLLDRFLPNANLLASWRHLQDQESQKIVGASTAEYVVRELMKVYNEACLKYETFSGDKLLVKDVASSKSGVASESTAVSLLKNGTGSIANTSADLPLDKYLLLKNDKTVTYYGSYTAIFDSRAKPEELTDEEKEALEKEREEHRPTIYTGVYDIDTKTITKPAFRRDGAESSGHFVQPFTGSSLLDDVKDDLYLIISHFYYDHKDDGEENEKIPENWYKKALQQGFDDVFYQINQDAELKSLFADFESGDDLEMKEELIAYRLDDGGSNYLENCKEARNKIVTNNLKDHYKIPQTASNVTVESDFPTVVKEGGSTKKHDNNSKSEIYKQDNPYKFKNNSTPGCFVPFMKVAVRVQKGIKTTCVIFCNKEGRNQFAYFISEREIDNIATMSNEQTFAKFEATDLISSTFHHWDFANGKSEKSEENWLVTDAFEGLGYNEDCIEDANIKMNYTIVFHHTHPCIHWVEPDEFGNGGYYEHASDPYVYVELIQKPLLKEEIESVGLDTGGIAQILLPDYAKSIRDKKMAGEEVTWGEKERDYGVIRTPNKDGYKAGTVTPGNMGVREKADENYKEPRDYDDFKARFGELFNDLDKVPAGSWPTNAMIANKNVQMAQIGYKGLYEEKEEDYGETVDPDKIYLIMKDIESLGSDSPNPIETTTVINHINGTNDEVTKAVLEYLKYDALRDDINVGTSDYKEDLRYHIPINKDKSTLDRLTPRQMFIINEYWEQEHEYTCSCGEKFSIPSLKSFFNPEKNIEDLTYQDIVNYNTTYSIEYGLPNVIGCVPEGTPISTSSPIFESDTINAGVEVSAVFPVRIAVSPITQAVKSKQMNAYFVKSANYWAADKQFDNKEIIKGEFTQEDWNNYHFLISNNPDATGVIDIESTYKKCNWRCGLFAPVFGSSIDTKNQTRESDVRLIVSEWEEASNYNVHSADHFIRDLYQLIKYTQGFTNSDGNGMPPINNPGTGKAYIHKDSYQFLYIPDEILTFDPFVCEKAFWLDRLICTQNDAIDESTENVMRSKLPVFTWQQVDYDKYPETYVGTIGDVDGDGEEDEQHAVYATWLFGGQASRSLYAFASVGNSKEANKVNSWGGYQKAHPANDLYGRSQTGKIFDSAFTGERQLGEKIMVNENYGYGYFNDSGKKALIKAAWKGDKVILYNSPDGSFKDDASATTSGLGKEVDNPGDDISEDDILSFESLEGYSKEITEDYDMDAISDAGLYFRDVPITLNLGGTEYKFNGTASAVYGYLLYREASALGNVPKLGQKAEEIVKRQLEKERKWTEVRAVAPGTVNDIQVNGTSGFKVTLTHTNSGAIITSLYCHMKRYPVVQAGQYVGVGTVLGYEGTTGKSGGYHTHMQIGIDGQEVNPTRFMYPFFSPFWYDTEEGLGARSEGYNLGSQYMSVERTIYPYQEVADIGDHEYLGTSLAAQYGWDMGNIRKLFKDGTSKDITQLSYPESDGKYVLIQNYVPQFPLTNDSRNLPDLEHPSHNYYNLPTKNIDVSAGASTFKDELVANPDYSDDEFMDKVHKNGDKIHGVPPSAVISAGKTIDPNKQ